MHGGHVTGHDVKGVAYLGQGEVTLGVELHQHRRKVVAARLQVDRAREAKVTHRVDRAGVSVARVGDGLNCGGELALRGLLVKHVAPLKRTGGRFHLPRRFDRWHLGLGAHVVQHHHQHILAVGGTGADMAVSEAVNDERRGIAVDGPVGLNLGRGQHGGPCGLDRPIGVVLILAVFKLRLLTHQQKSLAIRCKSVKIFCEICHGFLLRCWKFSPGLTRRGFLF